MSAFSINSAVLVGRLTRDPELRVLPSGRSVCSLRIACNSSRLDADGQRHERPNYFDVTAFGATADTVARYVRKGSRIGVDGRLEWREWETAEHERRQAVSVVADVIQFLDGATPDGASESSHGGDQGDRDADGDELAGIGAEDLEVTF